MWTDSTADAAATEWAQRYKAIRQLPMEEKGQRVEAYRKEERDYPVWQRHQDGGKLPWETSHFTVTTMHGCKMGCTPAQLVTYEESAEVELVEHGESPSKAVLFINGRPHPRKFCQSRPQTGKSSVLQGGSSLCKQYRNLHAPHFKLTRSDFKQATRPTSTAHVQKHRAKFNREDAKLKQQLYHCTVCRCLNHSGQDARCCPMQ